MVGDFLLNATIEWLGIFAFTDFLLYLYRNKKQEQWHQQQLR
jgi:hypothetical protein